MAVSNVLWRLASPYDAYVSHVARLNEAIERIRYLTDAALAYEAGLRGSVRIQVGAEDTTARIQRFRERVGAAAATMSDEGFEEFIAHLGGGTAADVESDRARTVSRLGSMTRGLEEYFAIAGRELSLLEKRRYNPDRTDVSRQLRENRLAPTTLADYRHELHELGMKVGKAPGR